MIVTFDVVFHVVEVTNTK